MDQERENVTQEQHDQDQTQEPAEQGYPEEQPGGDGSGGGASDRSGAKPKDDEDRKGGSATGNPDAAG